MVGTGVAVGSMVAVGSSALSAGVSSGEGVKTTDSVDEFERQATKMMAHSRNGMARFIEIPPKL
jgi:hypothetical protein